jgi:hypothetical protein
MKLHALLGHPVAENFVSWAEETRTTPITDHENKMVKERNKKSMRGSKKGVRVRRNCIVFNLAMENVLKGLPHKIRK